METHDSRRILRGVRLLPHLDAMVGALTQQEGRSQSAMSERLIAEALTARGLLDPDPAVTVGLSEGRRRH